MSWCGEPSCLLIKPEPVSQWTCALKLLGSSLALTGWRKADVAVEQPGCAAVHVSLGASGKGFLSFIRRIASSQDNGQGVLRQGAAALPAHGHNCLLNT